MTIPENVRAAFAEKEAYLKTFIPDLQANADGIYRNEDGNWQCHYSGSTCAQISMFPDGRCFETHGGICVKWYEINKPNRWTGLPVSDEEDDGERGKISHYEHCDIRWSSITHLCEVQPPDKMSWNDDKVSWYAYRHNELLGYLQSALAISQPQRHEDALKVIQKKCEEDQFDIVLLGAFQSGKSTTLDVLCGGRELSPQGKGQKSTSAVPVSIEVARPERKPEGWSGDEWAELWFKDDVQIKNEILDTFESYLADSESNIADALKPFAQGERSLRENFMAKFDLQNGEHRAIFRRVVEADWAVYGKDKGALTSEHRQRLEVLTIYLKFYGTREHQALVAKNIVSVDEAGNHLLFPRDWKSRAPTSLDFTLKFDECVFAFLDAAILHIQSSVLSRLNCRVTDCPGLGSSAYDSAVARRALFRADGVWFVKKCDTEIKASELGELFELVKNSGRLERTGMALNLWLSHVESLEGSDGETSLVDDCKGQLDREGYKFPVFWCNARFAYLSSLARRKIERKTQFSDDERARLLKIVRERERNPSLNDEALWIAAVNAAGRKSDVPEIEDIENFDLKAVDVLWEHSNMDAAVNTMAKIVLEQKGLSILVDKGSKEALEILRCYEQDLKNIEDAATQDAKKVENELARARKCMDKFVEGAEKVKKDSPLWNERSFVSGQVAEALVGFMFGDAFCDQFVFRVSREIYRCNQKFHWTSAPFKREIDESTRIILHDLISDGYGSFVAKEWRADSDLAAVREFHRNGESANGKLLELVKELETDGGPFAKGLPAPKMGDFRMGEDCAEVLGVLTSPFAEELRQGFWGDLWSGITTIFTMGEFWKDADVKEAEGTEKIRKQMRPKIGAALNNVALRNTLKEKVVPLFNPMIDSALKFFDDGIKNMKSAFDKRCNELEAASKEKNEKKQAIAEANRKIRTEQVQPLRERLEAFEKDVQAELWDMARHG